MSSYDCMDLCRLCLVKDRVSVPIFEGEGDVRQIFLKIAACLPVKVGRDDKLPKKICDDCVYKVELLYDFWNTTANAEKQLLQWLGEDGEDKQGYVSSVMNSELMKQETAENRLDSSAMQTEEHQNNMNMNMMDQMGLTMPIIMSTDQQQITSVPMASSGNNIQAVPGTSSQSSRGRKSGNNEDEEEESEEEENSDDECDNDGGINVKEEAPDTGRNVEPSFVNVSIPCDEAGPSGLQQQKLTEMPEMVMAQSSEGDPKSGSRRKIPEGKDIPLKKRKRSVIVLKMSVRARKKSGPKKSPPEPQLSPQLPPDLLSCEVCDFKCNDKLIMSTHLAESHTDDDFPGKNPGTPIEGTKKFSCNMCGMICAKKETLNAHYIRKHTEIYEFKCDKCEKKFKIKGDLTTHLKRTHSEDPVVCDVCGKSCRDKHSLYLHQKYSHYKGKFTCEKCGKCLTSEENLAHHLKYQHEQKERKMCEECGKTFASVFDLKKHMRTHTGEKPYACKVCNKTFGRHSGLNQHLLLHTGEKLYACDVCGRSFAQKSGLIGHRKKHQGDLPPLPHIQIDHIVKGMKKN